MGKFKAVVKQCAANNVQSNFCLDDCTLQFLFIFSSDCDFFHSPTKKIAATNQLLCLSIHSWTPVIVHSPKEINREPKTSYLQVGVSTTL